MVGTHVERLAERTAPLGVFDTVPALSFRLPVRLGLGCACVRHGVFGGSLRLRVCGIQFFIRLWDAYLRCVHAFPRGKQVGKGPSRVHSVRSSVVLTQGILSLSMLPGLWGREVVESATE